MTLLDVNSADELVSILKDEIDAPVVGAYKSTLGNMPGRDRTSVMLSFSLDPREEWTNGIFENSRYVKLHIHNDGQITLVSDSGIKSAWRGPLLKKRWRKTTAKSFDEVVKKVNKYIEEAR